MIRFMAYPSCDTSDQMCIVRHVLRPLLIILRLHVPLISGFFSVYWFFAMSFLLSYCLLVSLFLFLFYLTFMLAACSVP